jgi:hypothetical protein
MGSYNPVLLCQSLDDILMSDFIKCAIDKDYSSLIKSGQPTDEQINEAWISLISQFQVIMKSKDAKKHVTLVSKIESLNTKILTVTMLVAALQAGYDAEVVAELKEWGFYAEYSPETIAKDLEIVIRKLGNFKTQLAIAQANYDDQNKEAPEAPTKEGYMSILIKINKHMQQHYRFDKITAMEFASMFSDMVKHNELLSSQNKKGNG